MLTEQIGGYTHSKPQKTADHVNKQMIKLLALLNQREAGRFQRLYNSVDGGASRFILDIKTTYRGDLL